MGIVATISPDIKLSVIDPLGKLFDQEEVWFTVENGVLVATPTLFEPNTPSNWWNTGTNELDCIYK